MTNKYHVFKYRHPEEATQIIELIARVSSRNIAEAPISEEKVCVSGTHTRPGKGRRKKQG